MMNRTKVILLLLMVTNFAARAQQRYQLDVKKSKLLWKVETVGNHSGYLLFGSGKLDYSVVGAPATGYFTMDMKSIRSTDGATAKDRAKVDAEITTPGFFDTEAYPAATMDVKTIAATAIPSEYRVIGRLTIKGITNPVEFKATIGKKGETVTVKASASIDRTRWKIDFHEEKKDWDPMALLKDKLIADDIFVTLDLTFNKQ